MDAAHAAERPERGPKPVERPDSIPEMSPFRSVLGRLGGVERRALVVPAASAALQTAILVWVGGAGRGLAATIGTGALVVGIHLLFLGFLVRFHLPIARRTSHQIFLHGLLLFVVVLSATVGVRPELSTFMIPYACGAILATILFGSPVAVAVALATSALLALLHRGEAGPALLALALQLVGIFAVRDTKKRMRIVWAGIAVAATSLLLALTFELLGAPFRGGPIAAEAFFGGLSGLFSAAVAIGLLPLFESLLDITTVFKLQELTDLDHPLLRNLFLKAPGTYQHSMSVGNLAVTAAEAIGANHLLCRVGAYFHDIGKAENPRYFAENEGFGGRSLHDDLKPSLSASVIKSHVTKGLRIAREHGLPSAVCDFIPEHHGKSVIRFFYGKALESHQAGPGDKGEFRYGGPKPQTKETAIVMLADSTDAVSRTLEKPSPSAIEDCVDGIVRQKLLDGDLDECNLTLRELNTIAGTFVRVLNGTFHHRPDYPRPEEIASAERGSTDGGRHDAPGSPGDDPASKPPPPPKEATAR